MSGSFFLLSGIAQIKWLNYLEQPPLEAHSHTHTYTTRTTHTHKKTIKHFSIFTLFKIFSTLLWHLIIYACLIFRSMPIFGVRYGNLAYWFNFRVFNRQLIKINVPFFLSRFLWLCHSVTLMWVCMSLTLFLSSFLFYDPSLEFPFIQIFLFILPVAYRMTFAAKFQLILSKWQCDWNENIKSVCVCMRVGEWVCLRVHTAIQNGNLLRIVGIECVWVWAMDGFDCHSFDFLVVRI